MEPVTPPRLHAGDTVAVVSTSWGGPHLFPHVFDAGRRALADSFGLRVVEYPSARMAPDELRRRPEARADDLNAAFADPDVRAIVVSIGGDDSVRILPDLDTAAALADPKIVMGYSDTATQTVFYHRAGLVTFNGPAVMAGFAQLGNFPRAARHVHDMLFEPAATYDYRPYETWTESYGEWAASGDGTAIGDCRPHDGWHWLQGDAVATGRLFGGCFEVLEMLKGTPYWPDSGFWDGRVLFVETSEEKPSPAMVGCWLRNYGVQGVFDRISALLVGRARDYTDEEKAALDAHIRGVVAGEFGATSLPIVTNLDFGHTDPQWILPLGCRCEVDPVDRTLRLLEAAVA